MFNEEKTLIVVYKDELLINQFKKLVDLRNSNLKDEEIKINVVAWKEQVWQDNKKAGNIKGKVLFIDKLKESDSLIPILDEKYNEYGVKYGWAGNSAIIYNDLSELNSEELYIEFLRKLEELDIPNDIKKSFLLKTNNCKNDKETDSYNNSKKPNETSNDYVQKAVNVFNKIKKATNDGIDALNNTRKELKRQFGDLFENERDVKMQLMFFGIEKFCNEVLQEFMK